MKSKARNEMEYSQLIDAPLLQNVYRLAQKEFNAIPGSPWVYWVHLSISRLFKEFQSLGEIAYPRMGMGTRNNVRFLRYWWEVGYRKITFKCKSIDDSIISGGRWFPYMKGGAYRKWYGNQERIVNFQNSGIELKIEQLEKYPYLTGTGWIVPNEVFYFHEGITWTDLGASGFSARFNPGGFAFDVSGSCIFPENLDNTLHLLAVMNSSVASYILSLLNPTIHFQVGDLGRLPIPSTISESNNKLVAKVIRLAKKICLFDEQTFDFNLPLSIKNGLNNFNEVITQTDTIETQIDNEVYCLYNISQKHRSTIEAELEGSAIIDDEESTAGSKAEEEDVSSATITEQELAIRWISFAIGILLDRFQPGVIGTLGSAIYHRSDFATGSMPPPDEAEFDELVGPPESFAYIDEDGGRHVFSVQVELALQNLALPDGIAVFNEGVQGTPGHPHDLPTLVEKALNLMLGELDAREVIREATGGNALTNLSVSLRKFLEKEFFTKWHFKWYRKRPIYWPIQSSRRSYGFVLFHERITHDTFYAIQREPYLDTKRNAIALQMVDIQDALIHSTGTARKKLERELDELSKLSDELAEFANELDAITMGGYEPEPDWIDDGVILRMAPLWKVIPIWKSEPKKYWERLEAGDYDWSRIAMKYWPERAREKCKTNKSYAIAHGLDQLYQGE
jgi:hypothetical protein